MDEPQFIFEDQHLVVLAKPAGLLSQGSDSGEANVVDLLRKRFGRHYVGLVHRLDRNTSGLMVVAKRSKAAARLSDALRTGTLQRGYIGWLYGDLPSEQHWVNFLTKNEDENLVSVVPEGTAGAKRAELTARPLERWSGPNQTRLTLASFTLETGRGHQIRVQAAAHGCPLVGDSKYGRPLAEIHLRRPALHSHLLTFPHPISKEPLRFELELPNDLSDVRPQDRSGWKLIEKEVPL